MSRKEEQLAGLAGWLSAGEVHVRRERDHHIITIIVLFTITSSFMNNYYSLNDIIADGQKVPCNFEISVPKLGFLQGDIGGDITENSKLELPLWLAEVLAISGITPESPNAFVSLLEPACFSQKVINALKSDPSSVDLHAQSPVFTRLAERWLSLFGDTEMAEVIENTIQQRAVEIFNHANNRRGDRPEFSFYLDQFETDRKYIYRRFR